MKRREAVETMCRRCVNHEMCQGTGCEPVRTLTNEKLRVVATNGLGDKTVSPWYGSVSEAVQKAFCFGLAGEFLSVELEESNE